MANVRQICIRCLLSVNAGAYSHLILQNDREIAALDRRDTAFLTRLFYGTLERQITLDWIVQQYLRQPIARLDREVLLILRTGLYQCLYMDSVPVRAAVDQSVRLAAAFRKKHASGLVNAVLRGASQFDLSTIMQIRDPMERLSILGSFHPQIAEMLQHQYADSAMELARQSFEPSRLYLRLNTLKGSIEEIQDLLHSQSLMTKATFLPTCLELVEGSITGSSVVGEGWVHPMGLASQCASAALDAQRGMRVLDLCAAPGGKTLSIAQHMHNEGEVVSVDISAGRLALVTERAAVEGVTIVRTCVADASNYQPEQPPHRILCDVPCSGTGMMGSKPEIRHRPPDPLLPERQYAILENAARHVARGGRIVYSTCSIDRRENEEVVERLLLRHTGFRLAKILCEVPESCRSGQFLKFLPLAGRSEGFFIASIERI